MYSCEVVKQRSLECTSPPVLGRCGRVFLNTKKGEVVGERKEDGEIEEEREREREREREGENSTH